MAGPLLEDYLCKSQFSDVQADALSRIMADMTRSVATKGDLAALESRKDARFEGMEARMNARFESIEARLESRLAATDAKLTWRMIAVVGFFATAATLLNLFLS